MELASLDPFNETHIDFIEQVTESIGIVLNTIEANTRTEELLDAVTITCKRIESATGRTCEEQMTSCRTRPFCW